MAHVERISAVNPAAVVTVLSGFGLDGPYAAWRSSPLGDWAAGGHLFLTGDVDREPLQGGGPWDTYLHGAVAAVGTAAAAIHAARTGEGQVVDVSAIEALASMHQWTVTMYTHNGTVKRRWGNLLGESSHPVALYHCQDGDISIVAVSPPQWEALCIAMELWDLLADRRLDVIGERFDRAAEIDAQINQWLSTRTVDEAIELPAGARRAGQSPVDDVAGAARGAARRAPVLRRARETLGDGAAMPWMPFRLEDRDVAFRAAPALGADTAEVLAGLAAPRPARPQLDLHDVRILEFGIAWAGPLAGRFLGDLGADVVKVEHPATRGVLPPDPTFAEGWTWGTLPHPMVRFPVFPDNEPGERWWNRSGMFNKINRSKRSIGLDAKTGSGDEVLRRLIAASDVVLNNYSPRGARSLGIDPASVRASNPLGITVGDVGLRVAAGRWPRTCRTDRCSRPTAASTRPPGTSAAGPSGSASPTPMPSAAPTGRSASSPRSGSGRSPTPPVHVDVAQLETLLAIAGDMLLATSLTGVDPVRPGNRSPTSGAAGGLPVRRRRQLGGDHGRRRRGVARAGRRHRRRGDDRPPRRRRRRPPGPADELDAAIGAWTAGRTKFEVADELQARRVIAVPVMTNRDLVEDEHMVARGFIAVIDQPDVGMRGFPGAPFHLSRTPVVCRPCSGLGQDNAAVLGEYLGLDATEVAALVAAGVISDRPPV